jgi:hypothetical protein
VWTNNAKFFDGDTLDSLMMAMGGGSPNIFHFAGTVSATNGAMSVGQYSVVTAQFNGASSILKVDSTSVATTVGAQNGAGFTLGAGGSGVGNFGNIQVKEVIIRNALDSATQMTFFQDVLARKR